MSTGTRKNTVKIMVFGTFDGLHLGHLNFFFQARKLSTHPYLIVSVARDANVRKIKKNSPFLGEKRRVLLIKSCGLADKVVLGGLRSHIPHIIRENPDIIALGYDQKAYVKNLRNDLQKKNPKKQIKIIRLKPYKIDRYKNRLLRKKTEV